MLQSSGSAIRIAALLDLADRAPEMADATRREAADGGDELDGTMIAMKGVDVVSPAGVRLVADLTLTVTKGDSVLVYGASGTGKTSICRTLKGLWPGQGGTMLCPRSVMFLPRIPYCPAGASLPEQLAYPDRASAPIPETRLRRLLADCSLEHLLDSKQGDSGANLSVGELSLSERQQLAVARVLLRSPQFAVLDDATSAVSPGIEEQLFELLNDSGVTLITVSTRPSLLRFHARILKVKSGREGGNSSGGKGWSVGPINKDASDFPSPIQTPSTPRSARDIDADGLALDDSPAPREGEGTGQSRRPMPKMGDVARTLMLVRLVLPRLRLTDHTILRMLGSTALMGLNIFIQTTFISAIPGVLQSFVLQSDREGYLRFTLRALAIRLFSMVVGVVQQWLQSGISISWRDRLTRSITSRLLAHNNLYTIAHTDGRISDADQRISTEITQFVEALSMLVSSPWRGVLRTAFDACFVFVLMLRVRLPLSGAVAMVAYGTVGMGLIKAFAPDFTLYNVELERYSADFRAAHNRVNGAAESIAFADGGKAAETELNAAHRKVLEVAHRSNNRSSLWTPVQSVLTQSAPMYIRQILPFVWSFGEGSDSAVLENRGGAHMQELSQYIETLVSRAFQTMSSIMGMHQQFSWLFGSARRISDVLLVLDELDAQALAEEERRTLVEEAAAGPSTGVSCLGLEDATVAAPDGRVLARSLSFAVEMESATNLLISGAHGVGKSAVVRSLSGLWPVAAGRVLSPDTRGAGLSSGLVVIPQTLLSPTSHISLLDHLTYPAQLEPGSEDAQQAIASLTPLMKKLQIYYLVTQNAGDDGAATSWHVTKGWESELSKGEAQCVGILRALYRRPSWVVLDEATSAMAEEQAADSYRLLQQQRVRFISVSPQDQSGDGAALEALRSFHSQELTLGLAASAPSTSSGVGEEGAWALSDLPAGEPTETATTSS